MDNPKSLQGFRKNTALRLESLEETFKVLMKDWEQPSEKPREINRGGKQQESGFPPNKG
jgi:hypothetical protein